MLGVVVICDQCGSLVDPQHESWCRVWLESETDGIVDGTCRQLCEVCSQRILEQLLEAAK